MEGIARKLRDGRDAAASAAPLVLFVDDVESPASPAVFRKVLEMLATAVEAGRANVQSITMVASERPLDCSCNCIAPCIRTVDCFCDDSFAWMEPRDQLHVLNTTVQKALPPTGCTCVVFDGLPGMALHDTPSTEIMRFLADLCNHPHVASVLLAMHKDVAADTLMHQVRRQCTSWVELNPCTLAEQRWAAANGTIVHGKITARHKRAAGRVRVETDGYAIHQGAVVAITPAPIPPTSAQEFVTRALQAGVGVRVENERGEGTRGMSGIGNTGVQGMSTSMQAGGHAVHSTTHVVQRDALRGNTSVDMLVHTMEGGMRLGLTDKERASRDAVVLPYERQRDAAALAGDGDWRDRLPQAAGGRGPLETHAGLQGTAEPAGLEGRTLGHIDYVRDTDEEFDSDEDPDDDLDL